MISETIPVFLNGHPFRVPAGSSLHELLTREDPALAAALSSMQALATDGRGIVIDSSVPLSAGSIVRVARSARISHDEASDA